MKAMKIYIRRAPNIEHHLEMKSILLKFTFGNYQFEKLCIKFEINNNERKKTNKYRNIKKHTEMNTLYNCLQINFDRNEMKKREYPT